MMFIEMTNRNKKDQLLNDILLWKALSPSRRKEERDQDEFTTTGSSFLDKPINYLDDKLAAIPLKFYFVLSLIMMLIGVFAFQHVHDIQKEIFYPLLALAGFLIIPVLRFILYFVYWGSLFVLLYLVLYTLYVFIDRTYFQ